MTYAPQKVFVPILSLLAMAALAALPWVWSWHATAGLACLAAVFTWAVWLVISYLRWARGLSHDNPQQEQ
jgi:hypothetical protein